MVVEIASFGSLKQNQSIELRQKVLRTPLGLSFTKEELKKEDNQVHVVAIDNNQIIGSMSLVLEQSKIKMRQVCVDPTVQGKGIGKLLLDFAKTYALEGAYSRIYCHARQTAQRFYLANGYQTVSSEFLEIGLPHYVMELRID